MSGISEKVSSDCKFDVGLVMSPVLPVELIKAPKITYHFECFDRDGNLKWEEVIENLVTTAGKSDLIDKYLKGSSYTAAWYLGLKGAGSAAAGDTLASHAGWSELTPYAGNRPAITWGTTSSGSNTASAVSISINATATVAGGFTATVNTGTSGVLYSVGDFSVSRGVASGDTLNVTPTLSVS
jgi:hypothetical protein